MGVLIGIAVAIVIAGGLFYNPLRRKMYGIIGVGGSYMATIGIMVLAMLIGSLFAGGGDMGASAAEIIVYIVFMLIGVGYLVYVMIVRCQTVMQRIFLPIVAVMIAFGFGWRLLGAIVLRLPMVTNADLAASEEAASPKFPERVTDDQGETWELQNAGSDNAEYRCRKDGNSITVWYTGDYPNFPQGWRY